jgi:hypothetical protein
MPRINFAHINYPLQNGGSIDFIVFGANSHDGTDNNRAEVLGYLTHRARFDFRLKIDQSALVYEVEGQIGLFGDKPLVEFLYKQGLPVWTHYMDV